MVTVTDKLLTAEEYQLLPDSGAPTELVRGRIVPVNLPTPRHGQICAQIVYLLRRFLEERDLGHVISNDAAVVTQRNPDTVRGADVAFYSYHRLPPGPLPEGYLPIVPDLLFEVRSPTDRWRDLLTKVSEYLNAGVQVVCVLEPETQRLYVYRAEQPEQLLDRADDLVLPELHPDFRVPVKKLFEGVKSEQEQPEMPERT
jgi:Uma2 family endonuclease